METEKVVRGAGWQRLRILPSHEGMTIETASREVNTSMRNPTDQTGGKCMYDMYYTLERLHYFAVVLSKFSKCPRLLLKD